MLKKILALSMVAILAGCFMGAAPSENNAKPDETVTITTQPLEQTTKKTDESILPYDMEIRQIGNTSMLLYHYELDSGINPDSSFEKTTSLSGKEYSLSKVLKKILPSEYETKTVYEEVVISTKSNKPSDIISQLKESMDYDAGGYIGTLQLDSSSIRTEVEGTSRYSYPVRTTREFTALDRNDVAYIPKEVQGDGGQTLQLEDVNWTPMGGSEQNSSYAAVATYSGTASGSRVTGYTATARYVGEVKKELPGKIQYTVLYEEIIIPIVETPLWIPILLTVGGLLILAFIGYVVYYFLTKKSRTRRRIWNA